MFDTCCGSRAHQQYGGTRNEVSEMGYCPSRGGGKRWKLELRFDEEGIVAGGGDLGEEKEEGLAGQGGGGERGGRQR